MGSTILLSTHYMEEADELCDRVAIMDKGRIVAMGDPDELKRRFGGRSKVIIYPKMRYLRRIAELLSSYSPKPVADNLVMETDSPDSLVPEIVARLAEAGLEPERVEIRSPTLEDVFLNLTGRSLREVMT